jgi:hypothetical protein
MDTAPATFKPFQREAMRITSRLLSRDGLSGFPDLISKAAAARLRAGLRVIEAFLARLLVLMALAIEPTLTHVERPERRPRDRKPRTRGFTFRVFPRELLGDGPELSLSENWSGRSNGGPFDRPAAGPAPVPTRALFERLARLRLIAEAPEARARRLAFHMARTRPGVMLPPRHRPGVPNRWGVEASALYTAMGQGIVTASRSRPPPLPPPKVARPTISLL